MKRALAFTLVGALAILPSAAHAQNESDAARFFREGTRAFEAHEYRRAAQSFEDADHSSHAGAALLSAAIAWEFAGDLARAADDYEAAIAAHDLDEKQSAQAHTRFDAVDAKLAHVEIRGDSNALVAVGSGGFFPLPTHLRFAPGNHALVFRFPDGRVEHRDIQVDVGSAVIDVSSKSENKIEPPPKTEAPASSSSGQKTLAWIGIGVGGAAMVGGVIVGVIGLGARNSFEDGGDVDASLHDRAVSMRTAADVLLIGGGIVAGAGAVLLFTAPKNSSSVTVGLGNIRFSAVF